MLVKVLKIVWVLCSLAVLVMTLARYAPGPASDIGVFLVYGMLFLAFPVSLLVAGLFALLALLQEQLGVPLLDLIGSNYVGFSECGLPSSSRATCNGLCCCRGYGASGRRQRP
ncbi:MAG: hypothetical protein IPL70_08220 [Uliginosibacterium sp.]|nr:hypothetical protein [Uliginosibacterium sp.]